MFFPEREGPFAMADVYARSVSLRKRPVEITGTEKESRDARSRGRRRQGTASAVGIEVTEERVNWLTRLVSSTRLKHPLYAVNIF